MIIVPLGHEHFSVRKLPWVTIAIAALCLALQVRASVVEPAVLAEAERFEAEAQRLEQQAMMAELQGQFAPERHLAALDAELGDAPQAPEPDAEELAAKRAAARERVTELRAQRDRALERLPAFELGYRPKHDGMVRMLTSAFAHGGWLHLLGNLLFMYVVGCNMEDRWGRARYLGFYLCGALVSALAFWLWHPEADTPLVGASGAIAAAMGAFAVCYATTRIHFFYFYWLFLRPRWGTFYAAAWVALPLWFLEQAVMSLFEVSGTMDVAYSAHVGGFVFGVAIALGLRLSGFDARLLEARDRPERPEDEWTSDPLLADAQGLMRDGNRPRALASLEALLAQDGAHGEARQLALELAFELRDAAKVREHAAAAFTHWLRTGQADKVSARYRAMREAWSELELGEPALKAVIQTASSKAAQPVVLIDATSQLIRQHPDSALLPRALWAAAGAQASLNRHDLAARTLENIVAAFPMDPFAEQAKRRLAGTNSVRPAAS